MKVVLFGDSIRLIGYGKKVEEELIALGHEVFQPDDNCRFCKYTLRLLFDLREQIKDADVFHFNCGLWDVSDLFNEGVSFSTKEEYANNIRRIALVIKSIAPRVIFATTTPVRGVYPYQTNETIKDFNDIAVPIMQELGIEINDLGSLISQDIDKYIREDDQIHLTDEGIEVATKQVLSVILK
jgi:hypothetical protein